MLHCVAATSFVHGIPFPHLFLLQAGLENGDVENDYAVFRHSVHLWVEIPALALVESEAYVEGTLGDRHWHEVAVNGLDGLLVCKTQDRHILHHAHRI